MSRDDSPHAQETTDSEPDEVAGVVAAGTQARQIEGAGEVDPS